MASSISGSAAECSVMGEGVVMTRIYDKTYILTDGVITDGFPIMD